MRRIHILVDHFHEHEGIAGLMLAQQRAFAARGAEVRLLAAHSDPAVCDRLAAVGDLDGIAPEDLVIYHYAGFSDLMPRVAARPARKLLYYHNTTPGDYYRAENPALADYLDRDEECLRPFLDRFAVLAANSAFSAARLSALAGRPVTPVPILLEDTEWASIDEAVAARYREGTLNVVMVGRIIYNKNQLDAIMAVEELAARLGRPVRLFLVGESAYDTDAYARRCREYCATRGLETVIFTGRVPAVEKHAYLAAAELYLGTSLFEGFYTPLVEAMRFGLPIVAYAAAAVPETLAGGGLLVPPGDRAGLVDAMQRLLTDADLRDRLARRQRELLRTRYAAATVTAAWDRLLATLARSGGTG